MHKRLGILLIVYGLFLVASGVVGFYLMAGTSASSLFNGSVFGTFVVVLGLLHRQGRMWTQPASLSAVAIFLLTFTWRASVQWYAVAEGSSDRVGIVILLITMSCVSAIVLAVLFLHYRH